MRTLKRTNSSDPNFVSLVKHLDADLAKRDGADHAFYDQFNSIAHLSHVIVLYENGIPISCGAFKEFDAESVEIKRMFTLPEHRGAGHGALVLWELESWATELKYKKSILETGTKQHEAIQLYLKCGYVLVENYGQYVGVENSRCFEKKA